MGGPFLVEIVFCPVTRRGRKRKKGQNKNAITSGKNDGPLYRFVPTEEEVPKLDLSDDGPVFSALDQMMMNLIDQDSAEREKNKKASDEAKKALKNLLRSGIPGVESMFAPKDGGAGGGKRARKAGKLSSFQKKGFHKMTEQSRGKFMKAVFGGLVKDSAATIDANTAAAILAATAGAGDPQVGQNIAELLVPELGDGVNQEMMAALMSSASLINSGATTEEVLNCMKKELANSGLDEEDILKKTKAVMKAFGQGDSNGGSSDLLDLNLVSRQENSALKMAQVSPKEFAKVVLCQRFLSSCSVSPETLAKLMMVQSQLSHRGAKPDVIAQVLKAAIGDTSSLPGLKSPSDFFASTREERLRADDVRVCACAVEAVERENDPNWKEVKVMKDILGGASTSSAEAIGLNLQRAMKAAGLTNKTDLANALRAQKAMASLRPDCATLARVMNVQRAIAANGVPHAEIARVMADGNTNKEIFQTLSDAALGGLEEDIKPADIDTMVKLYDQLSLKNNHLPDVVEHIDKNLIQVRCSLEDVAENHIGSALARGERETMIFRSLCETLRKTNAVDELILSAMILAAKTSFGENMSDVDVVKYAARAMADTQEDFDCNKLLESLKKVQVDNPEKISEEDMKSAMESFLKDMQWFPDDIRNKLLELYPPPPKPEKADDEPDEIDTLTADEIFKKFMTRKEGEGASSDEDSFSGMKMATNKKKKIQVLVDEDGNYVDAEGNPVDIDDENQLAELLKRQEEEDWSSEGEGKRRRKVVRKKVGANGKEVASAQDDVVQQHLEQGGFIDDDGILCNEDGEAVLDEFGEPMLVDDGFSSSSDESVEVPQMEGEVSEALEEALEAVKAGADLDEAMEIAEDFGANSAEMELLMMHLNSGGGSRKKKGKKQKKKTVFKLSSNRIADQPEEEEPTLLGPKKVKRKGKEEVQKGEKGKLSKGNKLDESLTKKKGKKAVGVLKREGKKWSKASVNETEDAAENDEDDTMMDADDEQHEWTVDPAEIPDVPGMDDMSEAVEEALEAVRSGVDPVEALELAEEYGASEEEMELLRMHLSNFSKKGKKKGKDAKFVFKLTGQNKGFNKDPKNPTLQAAKKVKLQGGTLETALSEAKAKGASKAMLKRIEQAWKEEDEINADSIDEDHSDVEMLDAAGDSSDIPPIPQLEEDSAEILEEALDAARSGADIEEALEIAEESGATSAEMELLKLHLMDCDRKRKKGKKKDKKHIFKLTSGQTAEDESEEEVELMGPRKISRTKTRQEQEEQNEARGQKHPSRSQKNNKLQESDGTKATKNWKKSEKKTSQQEESEEKPQFLRKKAKQHETESEAIPDLPNMRKQPAALREALEAARSGADDVEALDLAEEMGASEEELALLRMHLDQHGKSKREKGKKFVFKLSKEKRRQQMDKDPQLQGARRIKLQGGTLEEALRDAKQKGADSATLKKIQEAWDDEAFVASPSNHTDDISTSYPSDIPPIPHIDQESAEILEEALEAARSGADISEALEIAEDSGATSAEMELLKLHLLDCDSGKKAKSGKGDKKHVFKLTGKQAANGAEEDGYALHGPKRVQRKSSDNGQDETDAGKTTFMKKSIPRQMEEADEENHEQSKKTNWKRSKELEPDKQNGEKPTFLSKKTKGDEGDFQPDIPDVPGKHGKSEALQEALEAARSGADLDEVMDVADEYGASEEEMELLKMHLESHRSKSPDNSKFVFKLTKERQTNKLNTDPDLQSARKIKMKGGTLNDALKEARSKGASTTFLKKIQDAWKEDNEQETQIEQAQNQSSPMNGHANPKVIPAIPNANRETARVLEDAMEAARSGADVEEALEIAEESGATSAEMELLKMHLADCDSKRGKGENDKKHVFKLTNNKIPKESSNESMALQAAKKIKTKGGSSSDALKAAKAKGASQDELRQIQKALENPDGGLSNKDLTKVLKETSSLDAIEAANVAYEEGASAEQVLEVAKASGATRNELKQIQDAFDAQKADSSASSAKEVAQAIMKQGGTVNEVIEAVKQTGASAEEIIGVVRSISQQQPDNQGGSTKMVKHQGNANNQRGAPIEIAKAVLDQGGSAEEALVAAKQAGAKGKDIAAIEAVLSSLEGKRKQSVKAEGLSAIDIARVTKKASKQHLSPQEASMSALSEGATPEQAMSIAKELGASKAEMKKISEAVQKKAAQVKENKSNLTASEVQSLERMTRGMEAKDVAEIALIKGASPKQVMEMAKKAGASESELTNIAMSIVDDAATKSNVATPKLSVSEVKSVEKMTKGMDAKDVAEVALSKGASSKQAMEMAKKAGASEADLKDIAISIVGDVDSVNTDKPTPKLSKTEVQSLEKMTKGMEAKDVAEIALIKGASPQQVMDMAKKAGASQADLTDIAMNIVAEEAKLPKTNFAQETTMEDDVINQALNFAGVGEDSLADQFGDFEIMEIDALPSGDYANIKKLVNSSKSHKGAAKSSKGGSKKESMSTAIENALGGKTGSKVLAAVAKKKQTRGEPVTINNILKEAKAQGATEEQLQELKASLSESAAASQMVNGVTNGAESSAATIDAVSDALGDGVGSEVVAAVVSKRKVSGQPVTVESIVEEAKAQGATKEEISQLVENLKTSSAAAAEQQKSQVKEALEDAMEEVLGDGFGSEILSAAIQKQQKSGEAVTINSILEEAEEQGATKQELQKLKESLSAAVAASGAAKSAEKAPSKSMEIAQAALSAGASAEAAVKLAKEQGASPQELAKIKQVASMVQMTKTGDGESKASMADLKDAVKEGDSIAVVQAAQSLGLTPAQTAQFALDNGASAQEIAEISQLSQVRGQKVNSSPASEEAISALQERMTDASPAKIAQAAKAIGASPEQVVQLAKEQGASQKELSQIKASLVGNPPQHQGLPKSTIANLENKMEGKEPAEIVEMALAMGASAEQAKQLAVNQGASKQELGKIQTMINNSVNESAKAGLSDKILENIQSRMEGEEPSAVAEAALSLGATPEQAVQMAVEQGASKQEIAQIKKMAQEQAIQNKQIMSNKVNGVSTADLASLQLANGSPVEAAAKALKMGATIEQAKLLAKQNGASSKELAQISQMAQNQVGSRNAENHEEGLSQKQLECLSEELEGQSPKMIAKAALAIGASPAQALQMAVEQGASGKEIAEISKLAQTMASTHQTNNVSKASGLAPSEMNKLQQTLSNEDAKTVAQTALSMGATPEQALQMAVEQGASKQEIREISRLVQNGEGSTQNLGVSNKEMAKLQRELQGEDATTAAKTALAMGASASQAMQMAIEQGASKQEMKEISKMVENHASTNGRQTLSNDAGIPKSEMANLQSVLNGEEPKTAAKAAMAMGASTSQVLQMAIDQGASKKEIAEISKMMQEPQTDRLSNKGVSQAKLDKMQKALSGEDPKMAAKTALAMGASQSQALQLAVDQGASKKEITEIKQAMVNSETARKKSSTLAPDASALTMPNKEASMVETGLSGEQLDQIAQLAQVSGSSSSSRRSSTARKSSTVAQDVAMAAVLQGASEEQAIQLAKSQGATASQLDQIQTNLRKQSKIMKEAVEQGVSKEQAFKIAKRTSSSRNMSQDQTENLEAAIAALKAVPEKKRAAKAAEEKKKQEEEAKLGPLGDVDLDDDEVDVGGLARFKTTATRKTSRSNKNDVGEREEFEEFLQPSTRRERGTRSSNKVSEDDQYDSRTKRSVRRESEKSESIQEKAREQRKHLDQQNKQRQERRRQMLADAEEDFSSTQNRHQGSLEDREMERLERRRQRLSAYKRESTTVSRHLEREQPQDRRQQRQQQLQQQQLQEQQQEQRREERRQRLLSERSSKVNDRVQDEFQEQQRQRQERRRQMLSSADASMRLSDDGEGQRQQRRRELIAEANAQVSSQEERRRQFLEAKRQQRLQQQQEQEQQQQEQQQKQKEQQEQQRKEEEERHERRRQQRQSLMQKPPIDPRQQQQQQQQRQEEEERYERRRQQRQSLLGKPPIATRQSQTQQQQQQQMPTQTAQQSRARRMATLASKQSSQIPTIYTPNQYEDEAEQRMARRFGSEDPNELASIRFRVSDSIKREEGAIRKPFERVELYGQDSDDHADDSAAQTRRTSGREFLESLEETQRRKQSAIQMVMDDAKAMLRTSRVSDPGPPRSETPTAADVRARRTSRMHQYQQMALKAQTSSFAALERDRAEQRERRRTLAESVDRSVERAREMAFGARKRSEGSGVELKGIRSIVVEPVKRDYDSYSRSRAFEPRTTTEQASINTNRTRDSLFDTLSSTARSSVPGLSDDEVHQLLNVFHTEGILVFPGSDGVERFRTVDDLAKGGSKEVARAFEAAIRELERRSREQSRSGGASDESNRKLQELLKQKFDNISSLRQRLQAKQSEVDNAAFEARRARRAATAEKGMDLFDSSYLHVLRDVSNKTNNNNSVSRLRPPENATDKLRTRSLGNYGSSNLDSWLDGQNPRFSYIPDDVLRRYKTVSPGLSNTENSSILSSSVRRRYLLRKSMEEDRERIRQVQEQHSQRMREQIESRRQPSVGGSRFTPGVGETAEESLLTPARTPEIVVMSTGGVSRVVRMNSGGSTTNREFSAPPARPFRTSYSGYSPSPSYTYRSSTPGSYQRASYAGLSSYYGGGGGGYRKYSRSYGYY